jgi:hypothetical protein
MSVERNMKHSTKFSRLRILPAILFLSLSVIGQQPPDAAVKLDLALEVDRGVDRKLEIPAFDGGGGEAANFQRIKSWKPSNGEVPVVGIVFKIGREADIVITDLSLRLENDKVINVGTYRLAENETVNTDELTKFGLEPLGLKVVKAKPRLKDPSPPIMPKVEIKTKAVDIVSFYQTDSPSNSFQLSLRNVSNKNIIALDMFMPSADGNGGSGQRSQGERARPIMLPGSILVQHIGVSRSGRMTPDGYVPDVPRQQTLIVRTVVFDDGTYDGLVEPAAEIEAERKGLNIQRRRILRLLQEPKKSNDGVVLTTVSDLKEQAYSLGKASETSVVLALIGLFPSLDEKSKTGLQSSVENGLRNGKLEFLRYINDFEDLQKRPGEHITFAKWIEQTMALYEKLTTEL